MIHTRRSFIRFEHNNNQAKLQLRWTVERLEPTAWRASQHTAHHTTECTILKGRKETVNHKYSIEYHAYILFECRKIRCKVMHKIATIEMAKYGERPAHIIIDFRYISIWTIQCALRIIFIGIWAPNAPILFEILIITVSDFIFGTAFRMRITLRAIELHRKNFTSP